MTCHVFGDVWCSCAATYALRRPLQDFGEVDPRMKSVILDSFYADDMLVSTKSVNQAKMIVCESRALLEKGGFHLTKFLANDSSILSELPVCELAIKTKDLHSDCKSKALGLKWNISQDNFYFDVQPSVLESVTRRKMLSTVSSLYDPLGLLSPVLIVENIIF